MNTDEAICLPCTVNMHHDCPDIAYCACARQRHSRPITDVETQMVKQQLESTLPGILDMAVRLGILAVGCSMHDLPPLTDEESRALAQGEDVCVSAWWIVPQEEELTAPHHTHDPRAN